MGACLSDFPTVHQCRPQVRCFNAFRRRGGGRWCSRSSRGGGALGGVFAGLTLPIVALYGGWRGAVVFATVLVIIFVAIVQPFRERIDEERDRQRRLSARSFLSIENLSRPVRALTSVPGLFPYALGGGLLGMTQGCWNAFPCDISWSLISITVFRAPARSLRPCRRQRWVVECLWAGFADRAGSGITVMRIAAIGSFVITGVLALAGPDWPFWAIVLIALVSGVGVNGWNGVNISEVTTRAPRHLIGEASAGCVVIIMCGHIRRSVGIRGSIVTDRSVRTGLHRRRCCVAVGAATLWSSRSCAGFSAAIAEAYYVFRWT